jgi:hypothetical protein
VRRFMVLLMGMLAMLVMTTPALAQPGNDDLATATGVNALPFNDAVDTTDATVEPGEPLGPDEFCPPRGATVWYELTFGSSQPVAVDTAGSDYDTTLAVYTGTGYGDLARVACNDDTFFGLQAALSFDAEAGVTYLVQVGSFGEGPGGALQISFDEPGKTTGKPLIFKSQFRGRFADAFMDEFDEETGAFAFTSVNLFDGRSHQEGKPSKFSSLFVSMFEETFDEEAGTFTFTDWFGNAELGRDQFAIDKKLKTAWVLADLTLQGQTCTGSFEFDGFECTDLGTVDVTADVVWDGIGGIQKSQFREKTTVDGIRFMFRGNTSSRNADVSGGLSGDLIVDLNDAFGSLNSQSTGDFFMFRGAGLP